MTVNLPADLEDFIRSRVSSGRYASADEAVADAVRRLMQEEGRQAGAKAHTALEEAAEPSHKPIWEVIEEENRLVPPEVWDDLPTDLSEQHDHYIYGGPKRSTA